VAANERLMAWLRDQCADFVFAPAGVYLIEGGDHEWPLVAENPQDLEAQLDSGGHLTALPKEPAALANVIEVALVDFLLHRLAEVDGAEARRGAERSYPDLEISGPVFGGGYHAIDVKVAKLSRSGRKTQSRCTLYTGNTYFRHPSLDWSGIMRPFAEYESHLDILGLYRFDEGYRGRVRDLELLVHESWRIASRQRSSTTREYIGAIDDVEALRAGAGEFETEDDFYRYWRKFNFRMTRSVEQQLEKLLREATVDRARALRTPAEEADDPPSA
jgi:hypothetical protein